MGKGSARVSLVFPTVRHAPVLHKLQYKFPFIRNVWNHIQTTTMAIGAKQAQKDHRHQETVSIPVRLDR